MSTYRQPKLDWKAESIPKAEDFNRIEGNWDTHGVLHGGKLSAFLPA